MSNSAIQVEGLHKRYGAVTAVDEVSFEVREGEIFGVVGPNGAGKTTAIECMEGLRRPDRGSVRVLGLDPLTGERELRQIVGVQLQNTALPARLRVWEALDLFASFYEAKADWPALLDRMGLGEKRNAAFVKLSGGQKQRLFIALALVNDPRVVFLDELTTGLDPQARRSMWDLVRGIRDAGKTILLTTHFMEEAERLCDRVAIMDRGRIVGLDAPAGLIRSLGAEVRISFTSNGRFDPDWLSQVEGVVRVEREGERVSVHGRGDAVVGEAVSALSARGIQLRDLRTEQASLEDVFLALTGNSMRD
jgi:ABC-2 type transport system ATP-binding protein